MDYLKRLMQRFPVLIDMEGELMRAYDLLSHNGNTLIPLFLKICYLF